MKLFLIVYVVVLLGATTFGQVSLLQQRWEYNWYWNRNAQTLRNDISFVFPQGDGAYGDFAQALITNYSVVSQMLTTTVRIDVLSGAPMFNYGYGPDNPCLSPATIRPYFELAGISDKSRHNNIRAVPIDAQYWRWWSNPVAIVLAEGTYTISVPYTPAAWSSVNGVRGTDSQDAMDGFVYTINHLGKVGFTLGGGCFFGHGVATTGGDAKLTVLQYDVN